MPKLPVHTLVWIAEEAAYELWTQGCRERLFRASEEAAWLAWLETHVAFSFRGQRGSLNVRKEQRQRGQGYWYSYRGVARRTIKRYLGSTARVTLARLEEIAGELEPADDAEHSQPATSLAQPEKASLLLPLSFKFRVPRLREQLVERPRLLQLLEDGRAFRLTLLSAPAGFGKTTLVGQWLASARQAEPTVAWVSLDERDDDPARFWRCVVTACQGMLGERAHLLLEYLSALGRSPALLEAPVLELVLTTFLDEIASLPGQRLLVLEDYQFVTQSRLHDSLAFWLEHLSPNMHLILLTRHDPPLPLAQWRVRGFLHEIRSDTLRFTADEATLFFQHQSTQAVSHAVVLQVLERTEGWIAGLQLAVLALNAQETPGSLLAGHQRSVADYLVQEVLKRLPETVQRFLLQTSLLERFQGQLCEAVTGQADGQGMLAWLEQANLFLVPLDETRQWYRYHHIFREMLFQRLARSASSDIAELHRRAGRWFLQERMPGEAVAHAYAAGDFLTLAECIEQHHFELLQQGENATLVSWIRFLPENILFTRLQIFFLACMENMALQRQQDTIELLNAYAHQYHLPLVGTDDVDALERALCEHAAQRCLHPEDHAQRAGIIFSFLGFYATLTLVTGGNVALYKQIRQRSESYAPANRLRKQEGWFAALLQGDIQGAIADLMQNLTESSTRQGQTILFAYLYPALISLLAATGQLQQRESIARRMLQRQDTLDARLNHGSALIDLGSIAYERNQLAQAEASIQAGLPLCQYPGTETARLRGLLLLAKIKRARGESSQARVALQECEVELSKSNLEVGTLQNWRGLLTWEALNQGDVEYARLWLQECPVARDLVRHLNPLSANIHLTQAFCLLRCGQGAEAERLLSDLDRWTRQLDLCGLLIPLLALQSILARQKGEISRAETIFKEALALAEEAGYARTLLDLGEEMQALLLHLWNQQGQRASARYLGWLLASVKGQETRDASLEFALAHAQIEPLSQRERDVLREIVAGYSNQEIARHLVISLSTVKSHVNSIYRKLQTKSRVQTIIQAHALHLCIL